MLNKISKEMLNLIKDKNKLYKKCIRSNIEKGLVRLWKKEKHTLTH